MRIFEPFYTTKDDSLGLGLPIVHKIVTSHRGQIEVDNQPGKGVNFIITLPAQKGAEKKDRKCGMSEAHRGVGPMKKILVVDDEESIRFLYKEELEEEGINVRVIDCYSIKPLDERTLKQASEEVPTSAQIAAAILGIATLLSYHRKEKRARQEEEAVQELARLIEEQRMKATMDSFKNMVASPFLYRKCIPARFSG
jgi:C4-dicarboxylate-specific signal transduction histidine kinase